ncbi:MAG: hypothetical protein IJT72_06950 [Lachnospiraceae bacterium]|nr:hypothetical protein [Lachnospiraceae bacterium]
MEIVNKTTLKSEYISVDGSFGGNQRWLRVDEKKANTLSDYGCGLISANDVLLYISDLPVAPSKDKYIAAIRDMNRRYFRVLPFLGLSGILMSFYMKLYLFLHKKHFKSRYKVRWRVSSRKILTKISEMLENDIPVVLSVGPCFIRGRKKELPLYSLKQQISGNTVDAVNHENHVSFEQINSVKDHYVNVTGIYEIYEDNDTDVTTGTITDTIASANIPQEKNSNLTTMLEISSWGKKYYINFDEYISFVKKHDNFLFSNILYIKKK